MEEGAEEKCNERHGLLLLYTRWSYEFCNTVYIHRIHYGNEDALTRTQGTNDRQIASDDHRLNTWS